MKLELNNKFKEIFFSPYIISLIVTVISLLIFEYDYGISDGSIYVPMVKKIINPNLYPNDLMLNTLKNMHSFFFYIMGFLGKKISLETLFFLFYLIFTYLTALSIYYLALAISKNNLAAVMSLFLLIKPKIGFTWNFIGIGYGIFAPPVMAAPFVFTIFRLMFLERYAWAFILTGITFNIHGTLATYILIILIFIFLVQKPEKFLMKLLKDISLFFIFSLPILLEILFTQEKTVGLLKPPSPLAIFLNFIRRREALFPWYMGWDWIIPASTLILLGILSFFKINLEKQKKNLINALFLAVLFMCFLGVIFVEYFPVEIAYRFALWRSTSFLSVFSIIFITQWIAQTWEKSGSNEKVFKWALLMYLIYFSAYYFNIYQFLISMIFIFLMWISFIKRNETVVIKGFYVLGFFLIGIFIGLSIPDILNFFHPVREFIFIQFTGIFLGWTLIFLYKGRINLQKMVSLMLFFFLISSYFGGKYWYNKNQFVKAWEKVQMWCKWNTDKENVFIIPPYMEDIRGFRVLSERSPFVTWEDGKQIAQDSEFGIKWWDRMQRLGYRLVPDEKYYSWEELRRVFLKLKEDDCMKIIKSYKVNYLITEKYGEFNFKKVYENEFFRVYSLRK